ncbi:MAG: Cell division protein FtsW [Pseudolabrys sp.]|nr:Cell division protein FtsW [Pseudolabrys sp.]
MIGSHVRPICAGMTHPRDIKPDPYRAPTEEEIARGRAMYAEGFTVSRCLAATDMSLGRFYYWLDGGPVVEDGGPCRHPWMAGSSPAMTPKLQRVRCLDLIVRAFHRLAKRRSRKPGCCRRSRGGASSSASAACRFGPTASRSPRAPGARSSGRCATSRSGWRARRAAGAAVRRRAAAGHRGVSRGTDPAHLRHHRRPGSRTSRAGAGPSRCRSQ